MHKSECFGVTVNLLTNSKGEKLGKSLGNGLWLDNSLTSAYEFYQFFWLTADDEVEKYLNYLTFVPNEKIKDIMTQHLVNTEK